MAGLGYAGSAIAVRGVTWPLDVPVVAAALAVPVFGLLAFWLYSLALNKSAVANSSAPLVVGQTLVPALVGLWLLGDAVREGWVAAVVVGMTWRWRAPCCSVGRPSVRSLRQSRVSHDDAVEDLVDLLHHVVVQADAGGLDVLGDLLGPARADDRRRTTLGFCSTQATAS